MPPVQATTGVFDKLRSRLKGSGLAKRMADTPIDWGKGQDPPPGIRNGIAQLIECKFDTYKTGDQLKGETYFRAAGVIISPESVNFNGTDCPAAGLQTVVMIPIVDRKNASTGKVTSTAIDQLYEAVNEIRKLVYPQEIDPALTESIEGLNALCETAKTCGPKTPDGKSTGPYFFFSTSFKKGREYIDPKDHQKKQGADGVWQNWHGHKGIKEDFDPNQGGGGGTEDFTATPSANGHTEGEDEGGGFDANSADGAGDTEPGGTWTGEAAQGDERSAALVELVALANNKDGGAIKSLHEAALSLGMSEGDFKAATWEQVAQYIYESQEQATTEVEDNTPAIPAKGEIWVVKQSRTDPKTKKTTSVNVKIEVTAVDEEKQTVTAREATGAKRPIMNAKKQLVRFKFEDLTPVEE